MSTVLRSGLPESDRPGADAEEVPEFLGGKVAELAEEFPGAAISKLGKAK